MKTKIGHQVTTEVKRKCLKLVKMKNSSVTFVSKSWGKSHSQKTHVSSSWEKQANSKCPTKFGFKGEFKKQYEKVHDKDHVWSPSANERSQVFTNLQPVILANEDWLILKVF